MTRRRAALLVPVLGVAVLVGCGASTARPQSDGGTTSASSTPTTTTTVTTTAEARTDPASCGPPHARTLASGREARVYVSGGSILGCTSGRKRSYLLGSSSSCLRSARVGPVTVADRLAAYAVARCGVDTGTTTVQVRSLATGRTRFNHPAMPVGAPESYTSVGSIVLRPDGAVAWIAHSGSIVAHHTRTVVMARSGGSIRTLDTGAGIALASLRLTGRRISWLHGATRRTASLG